jgi:hypothetical protein
LTVVVDLLILQKATRLRLISSTLMDNSMTGFRHRPSHLSPSLRIAALFAEILFAAAALSGQGRDTLFYSVVKHGEKAGYQRIWKTGERMFGSSYQYNDRGRGDSVTEVIATNDTGLVISAETRGFDYFKRKFLETFSIQKDSAIIVTNEVRKSKPFAGELFSSTEPTDIEPSTQYLLRHPGVKIPIVTGGTMMMLAPGEKKISFEGKALQLYLCEFYVNDNNPPNFVWLDGDRHFFAYVSDWFSTIREGYEPLVDSLNILQLIQSKGYYSAQMKSLSEDVPRRLLIRHVRLFDSERASVLEDMTVAISGDTVVTVSNSAAAPDTAGWTVVDGSGKMLLPGLWDMHAHYQEREGLNYVAGGVTHVRDMGNGSRLPAVRDAIRNNELLGPDISYMSGFIDQAGPFQGPTGTMIHNLNEGIQGVEDYAKKGYQQIKLYSSIDPAWVAPMAARAHALGLRLCGHVPAFMTAAQAVNAGYDEITHLNMVMLNFQGDTIDTRGMRRFQVVGERGKDLDLNGKEVNSFINLLQEKHISVDPTMNVFAGMLTLFPGDTDESIKPVVNWMPEDQRENVATRTSFVEAAERPRYDASFDKMLGMLKKLYDRGILIVSGTDGGEAFALEHELELYVRAGIPPAKALQCATYNAAKDCSLLGTYGTIAAGRPADMILVDGDPASRISDIRRVEWVIKNNLMYYPKKLFASVKWGYYY